MGSLASRSSCRERPVAKNNIVIVLWGWVRIQPYGFEGIMADYYTVVNRTNSERNTVWDGRHYTLAPREERVVPEDVAYAFKRWNIQLGSLDPRTGNLVVMVGIKELNEPCDPLETDVLIDPKTGNPHVELWNRDKLTGARPSEVVAGDNGLYSSQDLRSKSTLPQDTNFTGR